MPRIIITDEQAEAIAGSEYALRSLLWGKGLWYHHLALLNVEGGLTLQHTTSDPDRGAYYNLTGSGERGPPITDFLARVDAGETGFDVSEIVT